MSEQWECRKCHQPADLWCEECRVYYCHCDNIQLMHMHDIPEEDK